MNRPPMPDLSRKNKILLAAVLLTSILIPFLFWRSVWFGRPLTPEEIEQHLAETDKPRHIQHALALIDQMIRDHDPTAQRYYPAISHLAENRHEQIRTLAAWVMGQDESSSLFHETLLGMLDDPNPLVRRNAALGLVRFADPAALQELRAMLRPYPIRSPAQGVISLETSRGAWVSDDDVVAVVETGTNRWEIPAELPSRVLEATVANGEQVEKGQVIARLAPPPEHVWEALRGLYLIGEASDLELVKTYVDNQNYSEEIREQAKLTAERLTKSD